MQTVCKGVNGHTCCMFLDIQVSSSRSSLGPCENFLVVLHCDEDCHPRWCPQPAARLSSLRTLRWAYPLPSCCGSAWKIGRESFLSILLRLGSSSASDSPRLWSERNPTSLSFCIPSIWVRWCCDRNTAAPDRWRSPPARESTNFPAVPFDMFIKL